MEEALEGKRLAEPNIPTALPEKEFSEFSVDVAEFLEQNMGYKSVTTKHVAENALLYKPPTCHPGTTNSTFYQ